MDSKNDWTHVAAAAAAAGTMMATHLPLAGLVGLGAVYGGKKLYQMYKEAPTEKEIQGGHRALSPNQFGKKR